MALIPLAFVFDALDGRIARWRKVASTLGRELDSLADVISFGVAPAALGYACGLQGGWDWVVLSYFVVCGVSRLARYNVTAESLSGEEGKVKFFEGTPIPTSVVIVGLLAWAAFSGRLGAGLWFGQVRLGPWLMHPLVLVYALSGSLMISKTLRIPKP
jgi:CDP-diacylglycerol--serine O-phosphatidyltransferase